MRNEAEAFKWYLKAAEQGCDAAKFSVAACYEKGNGVVKNDLLAYQWYLLASVKGDELARGQVFEIEEKLTPEQRAEGQRLATEWQAAFEKRQADK